MSLFGLPAGNTIRQITIKDFGGVDFHSSPEGVNLNRSPSAVNMIRDKNGSLRKRMGYKRVISDSLGAPVYGGCAFCGAQYIHSGDKLYQVKNGEAKEIKNGLFEGKSTFVKSSDKLYLITKGNVLCLDGEGNCTSLFENAYVPLVMISKSPKGGGETYEDFNMI